MIAVGGAVAHAYDPAARTWLPLPPLPSGVTSRRAHHRMVWTGTEAVFFGGAPADSLFDRLGDGAAYHPNS